jgi:hypothetical protein
MMGWRPETRMTKYIVEGTQDGGHGYRLSGPYDTQGEAHEAWRRLQRTQPGWFWATAELPDEEADD